MACAAVMAENEKLSAEQRQVLAEASAAWNEAGKAYRVAQQELAQASNAYVTAFPDAVETNEAQHAARRACEPLSERIKAQNREMEFVLKASARQLELLNGLAASEPTVAKGYDRRRFGNLLKRLDDEHKEVVGHLK